MIDYRTGAIIFALGALAGSLVTDWLHGRETVTPKHIAEHRTAPNDVAVESIPGAKPQLPAPTKPAGSKRIRTTELHVQPAAVDLPERRVGNVICPAERVQCPPLDLRIDWNKLQDGQVQPAVRGPAGSTITGRDMPAEDLQLTMPRDKRLSVVGNPAGDVMATFSKDMAGRWGWAVAGGYVDGAPWAGAGFSVALR